MLNLNPVTNHRASVRTLKSEWVEESVVLTDEWETCLKLRARIQPQPGRSWMGRHHWWWCLVLEAVYLSVISVKVVFKIYTQVCILMQWKCFHTQWKQHYMQLGTLRYTTGQGGSVRRLISDRKVNADRRTTQIRLLIHQSRYEKKCSFKIPWSNEILLKSCDCTIWAISEVGVQTEVVSAGWIPPPVA